MHHKIERSLDAHGFDNVHFDDAELGVIDKVRDIVSPAGDEVVNRYDGESSLEKAFRQVRAKKARTSRNEGTGLFHLLSTVLL
ncbi:hypothetical protein GCM10027052_02430 [Parafrigoribacterium mesophilum]